MLKLGCDPEIFLQGEKGNLVSSIGKVGGSKHAPLPLPIGDGFCVQEDNVALEFNIPPASSKQEFVMFIGSITKFLEESLHNAIGLKFSNLSAASFPKKELKHPAAKEFGCDPDFNAWTKEINPRPVAKDKTLRSCGGHVHVGCDSRLDPLSIIQLMDLYLGVPSVIMDKGEKRKQLYGKAGAYRIKPYGVEYRVLSNFWIFSPRLIEWVWDNTNRAVTAVESQLSLLDNETSLLIQDTINTNNKEQANFLSEKYNLELVNV